MQAEKPRLTSRFVLRPVTKGGETELHLHVFMAELRPAADLARRVEVVLSNLRNNAVFRDLLQLGLLGFTIVVPSGGVKSSLERNHFEVETSVVVVEELQDLITH